MRLIVHGLAAMSAIAAFYMLAPSIRTGHTTIFGGLFGIALVIIGAYVLIVVALGMFSGTRPSQWPSIAKQLFRHDG
jgi:uncharacterized membrane protein